MILLITIYIILLIICYILYKIDIGMSVAISIILGVMSTIIMICFTVKYFTASITYRQFEVKRESIVETLHYSRLNNNPLENAAITKEIIEFNKELRDYQYTNTLPIIEVLVDDRINTLQPIK